MNILLFNGFLGSGKTSVIMQLAKHLVWNEKKTVAIIENEIGETGIDDKLIAAQGLEVKGVFAGCVCCQISGELLEAIKEIHESVNPDWLIIEATGLARPEKITEQITMFCKCYDALKTITLVDASRWVELYEVVEPLLTAQVLGGDYILINKVDLLQEEDLDGLLDEIKGINNKACLKLLSATEEIDKAALQEMVAI